MKSITVNCNNIEISNNKKVCLIAGPCQLETEQHAMDMAGKIKEITSKTGNDLSRPAPLFPLRLVLLALSKEVL